MVEVEGASVWITLTFRDKLLLHNPRIIFYNKP